MSEKKSIENKLFVEAALQTFAEAGPMEQKIRGLKELMKGGAIHSVRNDLRFAKGVEEAVRGIQSDVDPKQKLLALTVLARIGSRIKAERNELGRELAAALRTPPPKLSELGDAEDRAYAAQTLKWASGDWVVPYLARSIVEEETGEKARSELVQALFANASDLASTFDALRKPLAEWRPDTEAPGDSVAKRLKRILSAVRREILQAEGPTGDDVGGVIEGLVSDAFRNVGQPTSPDASADVTAEVAMFLHDLVRTRFSLAAEGSTYGALRVPSRWFLEGRWPAEARKSLEILSRDIEEAIALLAKQGITDQELLKSLSLVEGSREGALRITSRIADHMTGLPREIVEWLRRGRVTGRVRGTDLMAESSQLTADPALALLLIDSRRLAQMLDGPGQDLLNEVRVFEPNLETSTAALLNRAKALAEGIRALGSKRSLRMRGEPGEVVDYSPVEHEGVGGPIAGARRVRILRPLVERIRTNNIAEIVIKAAVEPE